MPNIRFGPKTATLSGRGMSCWMHCPEVYGRPWWWELWCFGQGLGGASWLRIRMGGFLETWVRSSINTDMYEILWIFRDTYWYYLIFMIIPCNFNIKQNWWLVDRSERFCKTIFKNWRSGKFGFFHDSFWHFIYKDGEKLWLDPTRMVCPLQQYKDPAWIDNLGRLWLFFFAHSKY